MPLAADGAARFAFLAEAGEKLSSSLDYEQTLLDVARLALGVLGDMCIVDIVEDGQPRRLAIAHVDPAKMELVEELRRRFSPDPDSPQPAARVLRSGTPELVADLTPDVLLAYASSAEHASLIRRIGLRSILAVPLVARGAIVGVMSLGITESGRRYDEDDVAFAMDLARRAALAVDNARLYRIAQDELARGRRADEASRISEERFRAMFEQSPLSTQLFGTDGKTLRVNKAFEQLWGLSLEHLRDYDVLHDPQLEAKGIAPLLRRAAAGTPVELPAIRYDPEETLPDRSQNPEPARWVRAFAYPIKDADGIVREVALIHEDVTAKVIADERIRVSEERLRDEDRRKDEFLATLAHELRNPLAPVRTGLDVLRTSPPGASTERVRAIMERQVVHMTRLIDDLLDVSRVTRGKIDLQLEALDIAAFVSAGVEPSTPILEAAGVALTMELPAAPLVISGDRTRLSQVLSNLLNNAAKFTPRGGQVRLVVTRDGTDVVLRLEDSGIGIPREMLARVFDMFVQVERHAGGESGLGIGLTLARRLVELHGGRIWVESDGPGRGTAVVVRLPLAPVEQTSKRESVLPPARGLEGRRVLVVDDNVDAADMLATLLSLDGHDVRQAGSGPEALALLLDFRPDIAFLDIGLPGMSGLELAREMRKTKALAGITLVAVTGWGQAEDRKRTHEAGFDHHLTKPVAARRVQALVDGLPPDNGEPS